MIRQKVEELREAIKKECGVANVDISIDIFSIDNNDDIDIFRAKEIGKKLKGELGGTLVTKSHVRENGVGSSFKTVSSGLESKTAKFCVFT